MNCLQKHVEAVRVKKGHILKFWRKFECQAILLILDFEEEIHILSEYYLWIIIFITLYYMRNDCLPRDEYLVFYFVGTQFKVVGKCVSVTSSSWPAAVDLSDDHILTRTKEHVPFQRKLVDNQIWSGTSITVHNL